MKLLALNHDAIFAAVTPAESIDHVRDAFIAHRRGQWVMPPKVYLDSPGYGDFRAMPARGGDLAILKWISSFPGNPERGLATVIGLLVVSDAKTSEPLAILDAGAVTALRTGAVAAVAALELAHGRTVGLLGCGLTGGWAARCMVAAGFGPGVCCDPRDDVARALADELGWVVGDHDEALAADIVCCVTPGQRVIVTKDDLRPGLHLNMLGADGPGKAEMDPGAVAACRLFCDQWEQASHGGELTGAVRAGLIDGGDVTDLGSVLTGQARGRRSADETTLFDSTGLAIQDLAIAAAAYDAAKAGRVDAATISL